MCEYFVLTVVVGYLIITIRLFSIILNDFFNYYFTNVEKKLITYFLYFISFVFIITIIPIYLFTVVQVLEYLFYYSLKKISLNINYVL